MSEQNTCICKCLQIQGQAYQLMSFPASIFFSSVLALVPDSRLKEGYFLFNIASKFAFLEPPSHFKPLVVKTLVRTLCRLLMCIHLLLMLLGLLLIICTSCM